MQKYEIDWNNFEAQRRTEVLKGKYCLLEIIIPSSSEQQNKDIENIYPVGRIEEHGSNLKDLGFLYSAMKRYINILQKEYPLICKWADETFECKGASTNSLNDLEDLEDDK